MESWKYTKSQIFNPILIAFLLVLVAILTMAYIIEYPLLHSVLWLVLPTFAECSNSEGGIGLLVLHGISYFLMLIVITLYSVVLNTKVSNTYVLGSFFGVCFTLVWLVWVIFMFLICGLRAH